VKRCRAGCRMQLDCLRPWLWRMEQWRDFWRRGLGRPSSNFAPNACKRLKRLPKTAETQLSHPYTVSIITVAVLAQSAAPEDPWHSRGSSTKALGRTTFLRPHHFKRVPPVQAVESYGGGPASRSLSQAHLLRSRHSNIKRRLASHGSRAAGHSTRSSRRSPEDHVVRLVLRHGAMAASHSSCRPKHIWHCNRCGRHPPAPPAPPTHASNMSRATQPQARRPRGCRRALASCA
jgi:hypothetical protein